MKANRPIKLAIKIMAHSDKVGIGDATGVTYVNNELAALVPPGVVTTTLATPAVPAGVVQVADVAEATLTLVQAAPPTVMAVAPIKSVPVSVTVVPPSVLPLEGEMAETVGGALLVVKVATGL